MALPKTLGELKQQGYRARPVKDEMRANLLDKLRRGERVFPGIVGYDETVIPQIVNAVLARHNIILLGLRGQAKSRIIRQLVNLGVDFTGMKTRRTLAEALSEIIKSQTQRQSDKDGKSNNGST